MIKVDCVCAIFLFVFLLVSGFGFCGEVRINNN